MKILVTGGCGFIGSAVVRQAIAAGHGVVNVDALTYAADPRNVASVADHPAYAFEQADIRDRAALDAVFAAHDPDAVMHLAAESHVDRSIDGPGDFISTNVTGTFHLLESARAHWTRKGRPAGFRFHHISTDEVFGSLPPDPAVRFTETTPYDPRSPYSASKAASDHLVRAWAETYGLPVVLTNCSNNYGPYHFPEKLIPVVILNALAGKPLPIYGDGSNIRDWLFVEDHADALLLVLEKGAVGRSYNIGGENERTNLELVHTLCAILDRMRPKAQGSYADQITFVTDRPGHDARYAIDPTRIREELGWQPSVTVEEGLERTVAWYLDNEAWWKPLQARQGVGVRLGPPPPATLSLPKPLMPTDLTVTLAPPKERYAFDGERASPWVRAPLWAEHLHRYLGVLHIAQGKRVLDIASGEGYGAALLHRNAAGAQVIGADVDPGIVARANRIYGTDGLRFVTASIVEPLPFDTAAFDLVTCFETIEHVGEQEAALRELRRVLAPGGVLAISTPDAAVSAKRGVKNPFHVRELEYGAFRGLLSAVFPHVGIALQRSVTGSAMTPEERMSAADPVFWWRDGFTTYHRTATLPQSAYFVAMASDRPIPSMTASFLNDGVLLGLINETVQREGFDFPPKKG